jgi:hypothetical protein
VQLLRSAGFDLHVELIPRDGHDDELIRLMLALPVEERLDSLEEQTAFFAEATEVRLGARR